MISKTSKSVNYMEKAAAYREKKEKQSIRFRYVKPSDIVYLGRKYMILLLMVATTAIPIL